MKKALLTLIMFLASFAFRAQDAPQQGGFRHIEIHDGLPSSEVYTVIQDQKGYIWMCTDAGVCRYNGLSFDYYTTHEGLPDNTVFMIREAKDGKIWAQGFAGGLAYFDGTKFSQCGANDSLKIIYNNGQRNQFCMQPDDEGNVTVGGLYTGSCFKLLKSDNYEHLHPFYSPFNDPTLERDVWTDEDHHAYTYGQFTKATGYGRFMHNGHDITIVFPEQNGPASGNRLTVTHDNKLLYSYLNRLYVIDSNGKVDSVDFTKSITGIDEDGVGNIWVGFFYGGEEMIPGGDLRAERQHFFGNKTVGCVFRDNDGGYWFCTIGEGVYYLPDIRVNYLTMYNGLPANTIMSLAAYPGKRIVIGLPNSTIAFFDPAATGESRLRFKQVGRKRELASDAVMTDGYRIFINTDMNTVLDSDLNVIQEIEFNSHEKGIVRNAYNNTWFMFSQSALAWLKPDLTLDSMQLTRLRFTTACITSNGTLWLGALNGVWVFRNGSPHYFADSLPELQVRIDAICEDANHDVWIATRGDGVFVIHGKKILHFVDSDGLASNTCRSMIADDSGHIWIGTNRGISYVKSFDAEKGKAEFRNFNITNGLLTNEVRMMVMSEDLLWIGTNEGLCWLKVNDIMNIPQAPPVYISDVSSSGKHFSPNETPVFNSGDAAIRVYLEGLYYRDPKGIKFKYRLLGSDTSWIVTENRELTFSGLAPGNYSLEVYALNINNMVSKNPAVFNFVVNPPFWRTWWFLTLSALVLAYMSFQTAVWRTRRIRRKKLEQARVEKRMAELRLSALRAQMNPHFIFNAINSIQHFVLQNDSDKAYSYLSKFSRLIRLVLDQSRADLVPIDQELDILKLYVELEKLRFSRPFRFNLEIDPWIEENNPKIPGMLIQPFVENSIWHGLLPKQEGEAIVSVKMKRNGNYIDIMIEDNGVGRSKKMHESSGRMDVGLEAKKSHGMKITEERIQLNRVEPSPNQVIIITDLYNEKKEPCGTRVELQIGIENSTDDELIED